MKDTKGFTLIELLVVIAIIGLLSTLAFTSLSNARQRANIAKAQHMIEQLHKVIMINYSESNGTSPTPSNTAIGTDCTYWPPGTVVGFVNNPANYYSNWLGPFITKVPKDPWGNCYVLDGTINESCGTDPNGAKICSAGPNGSFQSWNGLPVSRGDDICLSFNCF